MAGFRIPLLADVTDFVRNMRRSGDSIDDLARDLDKLDETKPAEKLEKSLDDLGDAAKTAGKQANKLEDQFVDAMKAASKAAKHAGDDIGDKIKSGAREAGEGMKELKEEANSSAKEAAASFDGSAESIVDLFQEVSAQAFAGFGPAGAAAGLALAAGIGIAFTALEKMAEQAAADKEAVIDLSTALDDVDGNPGAIDWAERLRDTMREITDTKEWYEFWQDKPRTRLEEWTASADRFGISMGDAGLAATGNADAMRKINEQLDPQIQRLRDAAAGYDKAGPGAGHLAQQQREAAAAAEDFKNKISKQNSHVQQATELNRQMATALSELNDIETESAEATKTYTAAVVDDLDQAGKSWDKYATDGAVNLDAYNANIEAHAQAVQNFESNLVAASSSMSAEALNYVRSLGPEAAPLLQAFVNAPLEQRARTAANWDAIGRAATDGYRQGIGVEGATRAAISSAQAAADGRPITIDAMLRQTLQRDVNNAVSQTWVPPIYVPMIPDRSAMRAV